MTTALDALTQAKILRFGTFEIDLEAEHLRKNGRTVRLQPQPFKLLCLLAGQAGRLVSRDDIRVTLWPKDTFVDFEQAINFAIKQVRDALGEEADKAVYIQTIPRRGYKFVAPVETVGREQPSPSAPKTDLTLHKLLWTHIADIRLAEHQRRKRRRALIIALAVIGGIAAAAAAVIVLLR